jgi:PAS domain S-box-containing protein
MHEENFHSQSAYRQVVAALRESEERYRLLVEGVRRYAIFLLGPTGIVLTWNQGVQELLGYAREEFIGQSGAICFNRQDRAEGAFEIELAEAVRLGEKIEDRSAMHRDGTVFGVHDIVTALRDGAGALIGFAKVTRALGPPGKADGQMDAQLAKSNAELATALGLLHAEVEHRRRLEAALLTAIEEERQRLGQDLHDELCQQLTGISLLSASLAMRLSPRGDPESEIAQKIVDQLYDAIGAARNLARGLHPVTLTDRGLPAALAELAQRVPMQVEFRWPRTKRLALEPAAALHIYRIAEEAVGNALKHSGASKIIIQLSNRAGEVVMFIRDNGKGFVQGAASEGMGLRNMQYRAGIIEGRLSVETQPGRGTCVRCAVPLAKAEAQAAGLPPLG